MAPKGEFPSCRSPKVTSTSLLNLEEMEISMVEHGKGGRSNKMKNSDCSDKREVAEA
jgi:hypothetical protein